MTLKKKYIAIHCTATKLSSTVDIERIRRWHINRGWADVGYHYYIRIDGTLELGRDRDNDGDIWEETGAHVRGYNTGSIAICYEGGIDEDGNNADTRTEAQKSTMLILCKVFKSQNKNLIIQGHRDFPNVSKSCPNFDVAEWLKSVGI